MILVNKIKQLSIDFFEEIKGIRRQIHTNPELSFKEFNTAEYVKTILQSFGISNIETKANTGVVATIQGKSSGKTIALRADLDALPIIESNDVPYKSQNDGVMHACGHDAHTASLLGAAKILTSLKEHWNGTVILVFQPGEEQLPGGATMILQEGVLEGVDKIFGQHVYPELPAGKVGFRPSTYMASADEIYLTVKGKGGHAALPHLLVDPVLIASHIIVSAQQLISRNMQPDIPSVLSFGKIEALGATNIIPNEVKIAGTFRTFNENARFKLHQQLTHLAEGLAKSMGGECEVDIRIGYPFLKNDTPTTLAAKNAAIQYLGKENVVDLSLRMTAEDFAFYSQEMPSCFYRFGVNDDKKSSGGLHTPSFDIDEQSLKTGMGLLSWLAISELNS